MSFSKIFIIAFLVISSGAIALSEQQQIQQIELYFNNLKTLQAKFTQINEDGSVAYGVFYLQRPGKFRLDYQNPEELLVISDGEYVINIDENIGDPAYIPLDSTPAELILRSNVKLSGDVTISSLLPSHHEVRVTLVRTEEPDEGSLTLIFQKSPFRLLKWIVYDNQGTQTQVHLSGIIEGKPLNPQLFQYKKYN